MPLSLGFPTCKTATVTPTWVEKPVISHLSLLALVASLVAQMVKHLPAVQDTWVRSPGWEDPLEKEMAIHSSTLAWKTPWMEETGRLQFMGSQRVRHN